MAIGDPAANDQQSGATDTSAEPEAGPAQHEGMYPDRDLTEASLSMDSQTPRMPILNANTVARYQTLKARSEELAKDADKMNKIISTCADRIIVENRELLKAWEDAKRLKASIAASKDTLGRAKATLADISRSKEETDSELERSFHYPIQE